MHKGNTLGTIFKVNFSNCQSQIQHDLQQQHFAESSQSRGKGKKKISITRWLSDWQHISSLFCYPQTLTDSLILWFFSSHSKNHGKKANDHHMKLESTATKTWFVFTKASKSLSGANAVRNMRGFLVQYLYNDTLWRLLHYYYILGYFWIWR